MGPRDLATGGGTRAHPPARRRAYGLGLALWLALWPAAPTQADDAVDGIELVWQGHAGCPDAAAVRREVRELLGDAASGATGEATPRASGLSVRGVVDQDAGGSRLTLTLSGPEGAGRRELRAASCQELASAAALIVALAVDPDAVDPARLEGMGSETTASPPDPEAATAEPATPAATEAPTPPTQADAHATSGQYFHLTVDGSVLLDAGALPSPALGLDAALGLRASRTSLALGALYLLPSDADHGGNARVAEIALIAGKVSLCQVLWGSPGQSSLGPCVTAEVGSLFGRGGDIAERRDGSALWVAASAGMDGSLAIAGPLALLGAFALVVPLVRTPFTVENLGTVHEISPLCARVWLGLRLEG